MTATTFLLAGCGTFRNLTEEGGMRVYGGLSNDVDAAYDVYVATDNFVVYFTGLFAMMVDMPFSAIGDTLTLPYVVPASLGWIGNYPSVPATPILRQSLDDSAQK